MVRVYIADTDSAFIDWARAVIARSRAVEVVGTSDNGRRALNDVARMQPDVLLTDIALPELDGITLLRQTRRVRRPPAVIICTRFCSNASLECASRYGASFFLYKPVDPDCLLNTILDSAQRAPAELPRRDDADSEALRERQRAKLTRALLNDMGISPRLRGSAHIVEAVVHFHDKPLLLRNLSKGLYAALAERMDVSASSVERAVRCAIDMAYSRGTLEAHFQSRPTNREFIEYVMRVAGNADGKENHGID